MIPRGTYCKTAHAAVRSLVAWVAVVSTTAVGQEVALHAPIAFVENIGQWPAEVEFAARTPVGTVRADRGAISLHGQGQDESGREVGWMVRLRWGGAVQASRGVHEMPGRHHYFLGSDPGRWHKNATGFASVEYPLAASGSAVRLAWQDEGIAISFVLGPGASLEDLAFEVDGGVATRIGADGSLEIDTAIGPVRFGSPAARASSSGSGRFVRIAGERFGIVAADNPASESQVFEAGLDWMTYLGGSKGDPSLSGTMALDIGPGSEITIGGETKSNDYPVTPGVLNESFIGVAEAVITRLSPDGSQLVFSTYLGGEAGASIFDIDVDDLGATTILGYTSSASFPVTSGAYDTSINGSLDAFVCRLSVSGDALEFSTLLGGEWADWPSRLAVAPNGDIIVTGHTASADFPVTVGAFDPVFKGAPFVSNDLFVSRLDPTGSRLVASTFLGGSEEDLLPLCAVLPTGEIVIAGRTKSPDFPYTPGAFSNAGDDCFVSILDAHLTRLIASTSFGGEGSFGSNFDQVLGLAITPRGEVGICGWTYSEGLPTSQGAFQTEPVGELFSHGFVAIFEPSLSKRPRCTYFGHAGNEEIQALVFDDLGAPIVLGSTDSDFFPTTAGAYVEAPVAGNPWDSIFVTRFSPDLSALWYSTMIGGKNQSNHYALYSTALAIDIDGSVAMGFGTAASDVPTTPGAFQTEFGGATDYVVAKLSMLPKGVTRFGTSTPGAAGPLAAGVTAMPQVGSDDFALTCSNAPVSSHQGWLLLGTRPLPTPLSVHGAGLWIEPASLIAMLPVESDEIGACIVPTRLPGDARFAGMSAAAQFFWATPESGGSWSSSNALTITLQP